MTDQVKRNTSRYSYLQVVGDVFRQSGLFQHYKSNHFQLDLRLIKIGCNAFLLVIDHRLSQAWVVLDKLAASFKGRGNICLC